MDTLCIILTVINAFAHDVYDDEMHKTHDCIHDKIEHSITQQQVLYTDHPLDNKRKLLQSTTNKYQPIRIRPYYDPLLVNKEILGATKVSYIKSLVSSSIHYLEQFVQVIPITGPLLIERCQRIWHYDDFIYNTCPLSDYKQQLTCQYATIPDEHIAESWYYEPNTFKSYKYKPAGKGITDADLVIYVSQSNEKCDINGDTLAWASICNLDQYGRPIAGTINFCPQALDNIYWKFDVSVTLHEIMHILVMSNNLFPYFYNTQTGTFYGENNVIQDDITLHNKYIVTDRVKYITQYHFGCNTLIGAPLENNGNIGTIGSHWESKYFGNELMCGTMYSAVLYLSYFTLALLEDSGWYNINYEYSDPFTYGFNEGCQFFNYDCINKQNGVSNFNQYWCINSKDNGCSYDYTTVAQCLNQKLGTIPSEFKYYNDPLFSGPESHDFCAFKVPQITNDYEQTCWDVRGNIYDKSTEYQGVVFGKDSRCVEVKYGEINAGYCFKHECIQYNINYKYFNGVNIIINDGTINDKEIITCYRNDKLLYKESTSYGAWIKCPNIDTICGRTSKPFNCIWGKWSDILNKCICSIGYIGNDCSVKDMNRLAIEAIISSNINIPIIPEYYMNGICITNSSNYKLNGFYLYDDNYENIPSYHSFDGNVNSIRYIYYMRYYSQWNIGIFKGDLSVYSFCRQSLNHNEIMNIENCKIWAVWNNDYGFKYDSNMNVYYCDHLPTHITSSIPTINPTNNPTNNEPTIEPTNMPTSILTNNPSISPTFKSTIQPSISPTMKPTNNPSISPTYNPIISPTMNPTQSPTNEPTMEPTLEPILHISSSMPTNNPSVHPTNTGTIYQTFEPTIEPTGFPSDIPSINPSLSPTTIPTVSSIIKPTDYTTQNPTIEPTIEPTNKSANPTLEPTNPTPNPSTIPTLIPTNNSTIYSNDVTNESQTTTYPTEDPSMYPTSDVTDDTTISPTIIPTNIPTYNPTDNIITHSKIISTFDPSQIITLPINNFVNVNVNSNQSNLWNGHNMMYFYAFIVISCIFISGVILFICCYCKYDCFKRRRTSTVDALQKMRSSSVMSFDGVNDTSIVIDNDEGIEMKSMLELTMTTIIKENTSLTKSNHETNEFYSE